jgi:hypothetical protein
MRYKLDTSKINIHSVTIPKQQAIALTITSGDSRTQEFKWCMYVPNIGRVLLFKPFTYRPPELQLYLVTL